MRNVWLQHSRAAECTHSGGQPAAEEAQSGRARRADKPRAVAKQCGGQRRHEGWVGRRRLPEHERGQRASFPAFR